jgi:nucleoside phosphorylase
LGTVAGNTIVIAAPLYRKCGTMTAAAVMQNVLKKLSNIRASLLVGLGGGMPSSTHDIRLGDVVVGTTQKGQSRRL